MAIAISIISFVWAAILAVFIPVKRIRTSIPNLAIVLWLMVYNFIHGVNSAVWNDNTVIRTPIWCDIATKILLGLNIALPGALLSIARELELVSSGRKISIQKHVVRNRMIFDILLCYSLPIIYMSLHVIAQDRRFDLVEDLGCSASIHPSTVSLVIVWALPLIFCVFSFVLCGVAIHHACRQSSPEFSLQLESRSTTMSSSGFLRRLVVIMVMTSALFLVSVFCIFAVPALEPFSWDRAHALLWKVNVVSSIEDIRFIRLSWWGGFAITTLYLLLSLSLGEETRDIARWISEGGWRKTKLPKFDLPLYALRKKASEPEMASRSPSVTKPAPLSVTFDLKSGWDDMLDAKAPRSPKSKRLSMFPPSARTSPTPSGSSSSSPISPTAEDDQAFMNSTLSYLGSPTAKTLGLSSPATLQAPPAAHSPTSRHGLELPPKPSSPPPIPPPSVSPTLKPKLHAPSNVPSNISAVLEAPWPVPPASPTPSLTPSRHSSVRGPRSPVSSSPSPSRRQGSRQRSNSRSASSSSSDEDGHVTFTSPSIGYPLYPTITPPHMHRRPFENASISSVGSIGVIAPAPMVGRPAQPSKNLKSALKKPSIKSLKQSMGKDKTTDARSEVIHMTVVQETV